MSTRIKKKGKKKNQRSGNNATPVDCELSCKALAAPMLKPADDCMTIELAVEPVPSNHIKLLLVDAGKFKLPEPMVTCEPFKKALPEDGVAVELMEPLPVASITMSPAAPV